MTEEKLKVLLVDDEKEFVESLSERLQLRDLDAEVAYSGEEALKALNDGDPRVMVLDLRMPGIDGLEVLRRVKETQPHMQVVILTGHGSGKDQRSAERLGAFAYLKKPVDMDLLLGTLQKAWSAVKKSKKKLDSVMMAAAFAQAGEDERARDTIDDTGDDSK